MAERSLGHLFKADHELDEEVIDLDEVIESGIARRRPRNSMDKMQGCPYPGCSKTFYHARSLYRHQKAKHGITSKITWKR